MSILKLKPKSKQKKSKPTKLDILLNCSKCGLDKPVADFYPRKNSRRGYQYRCKKCIRFQYIETGKWIKCACGCDERLLDRGSQNKIRRYIRGHRNRRNMIVNIISCECGCGQTLLDRDSRGTLRKYIYGHQSRGESNHSWKGRNKRHNYWYVYRPNHHEADSKGYVEEHRVVYEEYHKCCLLSWAVIHHDDGDGLNNEISNLILTSIWEHPNKYHRKDLGQVCQRCGSSNVHRNGLRKGKQVFQCICWKSWTINKIQGIDYNQICKNCGSKHIVKHGMQKGKRRFKCCDCRKEWYVLVGDLVVKKSDNDLRYESYISHHSQA
jgi:transposase-like protein